MRDGDFSSNLLVGELWLGLFDEGVKLFRKEFREFREDVVGLEEKFLDLEGVLGSEFMFVET